MLNTIKELLPAMAQLCEKRMLVVTSMGKSGSTWVQKILNAHPEIYCAGEGKFHHLLSSLTQPLNEYNNILKHTNDVIYGENTYYTLWNEKKSVALIHYLIAMAFLSARIPVPSGVTYIGDKDTGYLHNIDIWFNHIFPDARCIHVIRDCRDSVVSNMHHLNRQGNHIEKNTAPFYQLVGDWSKAFRQTLEKARDAFAGSPESYFEIRYEDLLEKPEAAVKKLFGFLNVRTDSEIISRSLDEATFEQLSKGRKPGQEDKNSFYRKGVKGDWVNYFDKKAEDICIREAGNCLRELGYL